MADSSMKCMGTIALAAPIPCQVPGQIEAVESATGPCHHSLSKTSQETGDQDVQYGQTDGIMHPAKRGRNFRTYFTLK